MRLLKLLFAAVMAVIGAFFFSKKREQERLAAEAERREHDARVAKLKQHAADAKAERDAKKAATDAQVSQIQQAAEQEKSRDSVDVANDLIADARADVSGKGG